MKILNICKKSLDKEACKVARLLFSTVNDLGINKTICIQGYSKEFSKYSLFVFYTILIFVTKIY